MFLPRDNFPQASLIDGIKITPVASLSELFLHLKHQKTIKPPNLKHPPSNYQVPNSPTLDDIADQPLGKRALQIAIAGRHNLLMLGPPGTGKSLLGKASLSLLPPLSKAEQISLTKLYSLSSLTTDLVTSRPFRSPHHTSSTSAILGGGTNLLPGEVSLAHLGILFLDEIPEFHRDVLEALRQPLEDRQICVSRAKQKVTYPSDFILIATANPCPCGYLGDNFHQCKCTDAEISRYQKKLSGPLLDRIDLFVNVGRVEPSALLDNPQSASIQNVVKNTITEAIHRQAERYGDPKISNASLPTSQIAKLLSISADARKLLDEAAKKLNLSARSYFKTIKVAQTITDLDSTPIILPEHISEALTFRHRPPARI